MTFSSWLANFVACICLSKMSYFKTVIEATNEASTEATNEASTEPTAETFPASATETEKPTETV